MTKSEAVAVPEKLDPPTKAERHELASKLRDIMARRKLTPTELAAAIGCSERQFRYYLNETYYPRTAADRARVKAALRKFRPNGRELKPRTSAA